MKKNFKIYALIWVIMFMVFNAVVFLVRPILPDLAIKYDSRFWIAWAFIMAAFMGNLYCAYTAFKADNAKKLFYSIPVVTVSYIGVILMTLFAVVLMLIPNCPAWVAAVVCIVVLSANAIAVLKVCWPAQEVARIDEKVKNETKFIKLTTVNAQNIMAGAKSETAKNECRKVCEALRYSDPVSCGELSIEEAKITLKMEELASAVASDDAEKTATAASEIVALVKARNNKCKVMK